MLRWIDILTFAKYGNPEPLRRVEKTAPEWAAQLTPAQFRVLREHHTEPPYRNAYCRSYEPGCYECAGCHSPLFDSSTKYYAISGWPSFTQPVARQAISYHFDDTYNMQRVEVRCNGCGGHLGHVFPDGPAPAGLRYCINSESLVRVGEPAA
ncbi:peptide-methionine (R)-S-oxide reductase MsrB [Hymenobacter chitinivorans]|uniref:peptide-methionine (R)-S-oxide reductase n=1 Tax=Hymenobacter chitinivorans DSM 11115 TaxID=1121954 RepID=A0A2M9BNM0_9BACT|nr:peptide-methionine (R)-S-oxide reductase MsrB [Hymenobacter chitinivorans]PJJ59547.1 peptide-methionine (R)-S-oxide reductase [Hymenobacter chitinivorans DSM 11115]